MKVTSNNLKVQAGWPTMCRGSTFVFILHKVTTLSFQIHIW